MAVRVAINGFGRIGRLVLRSILEHKRTDIQVVAVNDLGPVETNVHLLKYDSVHGPLNMDVKVEGDQVTVGNQSFKVTAIKNPAELPHKELNVDIAFECTGLFTSKEKAAAHLTAGAKRVLVSAPCDGADQTIVYKVNDDVLSAADLVVQAEAYSAQSGAVVDLPVPAMDPTGMADQMDAADAVDVLT